MRAIAKWLTGCLLTATQPIRARFLGGENQWLEFRCGMGAVAEGLFGAQAATAPSVFFTRFQLFFVRRVLRDGSFAHGGYGSLFSISACALRRRM